MHLRRSAVVSIACGLCAGCADDGGPELPATVLLMAVKASDSNAPAVCIDDDVISQTYEGFDTDTPTVGTRVCAAVVDAGDHWLVVCEPSTTAAGVRLRLNKALVGGEVDLVAQDGTCSSTYTISSVVTRDE